MSAPIVGSVEAHEKQPHSEPIDHKNVAPQYENKTIIDRQRQCRHYRLFSLTDHNMDQWRFTTTELAINRKANFRSGYGSLRGNSGAMYRRSNNRGSKPRQDDALLAGPVKVQRERPDRGVQALRGNADRKSR